MSDSGIRLAELMAALSVATDLGMGQPLETALCSCIVAMRLAELLGFDDDAMRDVYYQSLLRYIGCNAETYEARAGEPPSRVEEAVARALVDLPALMHVSSPATARWRNVSPSALVWPRRSWSAWDSCMNAGMAPGGPAG